MIPVFVLSWDLFQKVDFVDSLPRFQRVTWNLYQGCTCITCHDVLQWWTWWKINVSTEPCLGNKLSKQSLGRESDSDGLLRGIHTRHELEFVLNWADRRTAIHFNGNLFVQFGTSDNWCGRAFTLASPSGGRRGPTWSSPLVKEFEKQYSAGSLGTTLANAERSRVWALESVSLLDPWRESSFRRMWALNQNLAMKWGPWVNARLVWGKIQFQGVDFQNQDHCWDALSLHLLWLGTKSIIGMH